MRFYNNEGKGYIKISGLLSGDGFIKGKEINGKMGVKYDK
jgi:hypothetical protein